MKDWRTINYFVPITSEAYKAEEKVGFKIKGIAINETITRNKVKYQAEELEKSAQSLIGKPLLKDHENKIDAIVGRVSNAYFDKTERNIKFEADIEDESISNKIAKKLITSVSVGAYVKDLNKKEDEDIFVARGIDFVELSLVAVPADPSAGFSFDMALDNARILKEAYEMDNNKEAMPDAGKEKCPECGKMIPKDEMKAHMKDMHSAKAEKLGEEKMVGEIQTPVQPQVVEQKINVDTSKFETLVAEMQKKIEELSVQLNKKEEIKPVETATIGKILPEKVIEPSNTVYEYFAGKQGKVNASMKTEEFYNKYSALKGRN